MGVEVLAQNVTHLLPLDTGLAGAALDGRVCAVGRGIGLEEGG